jgi:hypothetical protein
MSSSRSQTPAGPEACVPLRGSSPLSDLEDKGREPGSGPFAIAGKRARAKVAPRSHEVTIAATNPLPVSLADAAHPRAVWSGRSAGTSLMLSSRLFDGPALSRSLTGGAVVNC